MSASDLVTQLEETLKDLGLVTAYGYALSKGYTGTEEEFATLMANYAVIGQVAATAALDAEARAKGTRNGVAIPSTDPAYNDHAKYYAELAASAKVQAETAKTAAETANSNAQAAKTAAQTAKTNAESANTSAQAAKENAVSANTNAQAAKLAAETAQERAETARTGAESAQTAAETAQTAAETAQTSAETAQAAAEAAQSDAHDSKVTANQKAEACAAAVLDAEAYSNGTRNGTPIGSNDPAYHKDARYYAEKSKEYSEAIEASGETIIAAQEAAESAQAAADAANEAINGCLFVDEDGRAYINDDASEEEVTEG